MIEIFNSENIFLIVLAFIWLVFASIQDLRKREVANWLNFSLIGFALAYRAFYSAFTLNYMFFLYGVIGFAIFFALAYAFYYSRLFAGGDAKLLMALGAVLPFSGFTNTLSSFVNNLFILGFFIFLLLLVGGVYGLLYSLALVLIRRKEFSREFKKQFLARKKLFFLSLICAFVFFVIILAFGENLLLVLPVIILLFPFLFIYAKSVEESCLVKFVSIKELREGDWLYHDLKIKNKKIKTNWQGLSSSELEFIRKNYKKKILIKQGIPFVPSFLIAFIILLILWNLHWDFYNLFGF